MANNNTKKYVVEYNTGDMYWDNIPEVEEYDTIEEVIENLWYDMTEEQINDLREYGYATDDDEEVWRVIER